MQLMPDMPAVTEFRDSVLAGLSKPARTLECKYFYDAAGSDLFDRICELPEYYPTRAEAEILERHAPDIAALCGRGAELVELGSGFGHKTRVLLAALDEPSRYLPVDISAEPMLDAKAQAARAFPGLEVLPVGGDFTAALALPPRLQGAPRILLFMGSTIGNFTTDEASALLARLKDEVRPDLFLVGVDLVKDAATLVRAYDDEAGVTAAFNLNLLARINRELGGNIVPANFRHEARWNESLSRIEMHLVSKIEQTLLISGVSFHFTAGESIHTENSHKYSLDGFAALAAAAGWQPVESWTDSRGMFSVHALS